MTESTSDIFSNGHLLMRAMGRWPSFHDANVKSAVRKDTTVRVVLHAFEMGELRSDGYYALVNHHLVTIEMSGITECTLPKDYEGDILFGLSAESAPSGVKVEFDSAIDPGRCWHVICERVSVIDVVPCNPDGGVG